MFGIYRYQGNANQNYSDSILHLSKWLRSKTQVTAHVGKDVEKNNSSIAGGSANSYNYFGKQYVDFSENQESIYFKTHLLLGIYPKYTPSYHKDTCSSMFIAALFLIVRN